MARNTTALRAHLKTLGLTADEATIFLSVLDKPKTQLQVSRDTGIARSSVYRLVDEMIEKSLLHELSTEDGKIVECARPEALELLVLNQEEAIKGQRASLDTVLPVLLSMAKQEDLFGVKTYSGLAGHKQMLWNELKTTGEICMFSCGSLDKSTGKFFAEKFRQACLDRKIVQRAIENSDGPNPTTTGITEFFDDSYNLRLIDSSVLPITVELTIHDDTISIYNNWDSDVYLGAEIQNPFLAEFMRAMFEYF